uniref:TPR_REGION domain-containing protein n=1 Tax=Haemonchus contortus TaxID=6289 RepID=A0A7I4Z1K6_HAECO
APSTATPLGGMQQAEIASRSWTCLELAKEGERFCREGKFRDAIPLFLDALNQGTNDLSTLSAIYCQLGNAYYSTNDMQKAFSYHCYDMMIAKLMNDDVGEAKACGNIGNVLKMQNSFLDAIVFTKRQLELAEQLNDKKCMARALYNLGTIHHARAKLAGKNTSHTVVLAHKDANANAEMSQNSSSSYSYHDDLNLAFQYYCRSAGISRKLEDHLNTGRIYGCMGNVLHLLGDYKGAIDSHTKRLSVASQFGDHNAKHRAYINLGNAHVLLSEIDQAIVYYQSALNLAVEKNNKGREAQCCFYLASASSLKPDYSRAAGFYLRHLSLARSLKDYAGVARAYTSLAAVYTNMTEYSKAAYFLACHRALGKEMRDECMVSTAQESMRNLIEKNIHEFNIDDGYLRFDSSEDPEPQTHFCRVANGLGSTEIKFTDQPSSMTGNDIIAAHNGKSVEASNLEFANADDAFFDLLSRMQSARLDEQRCDLSILASRPITGRRQTDSLMTTQNEAPEALIDLLMNAQGRRMDEQRATLLPGLNNQEQAHELIEKLGSATVEGSDSRIDDTLIDMLMRAQSHRMNEQRSELASDRKNSVDADLSAVTSPEDDVSALVMRMQSGRFEEQRAHLRTESNE